MFIIWRHASRPLPRHSRGMRSLAEETFPAQYNPEPSCGIILCGGTHTINVIIFLSYCAVVSEKQNTLPIVSTAAVGEVHFIRELCESQPKLMV